MFLSSGGAEAIGRMPRQATACADNGAVAAPRQLPHGRVDAIGADESACREGPSASRNMKAVRCFSRVRHGAGVPDRDAELLRAAEKRGEQVLAQKRYVRRAIAPARGRAKRNRIQKRAASRIAKLDRPRLEGRPEQRKFPALHDARGVGTDLDARADRLRILFALKDLDRKAGELQGYGGAQAGDAGACDRDNFFGCAVVHPASASCGSKRQ